MKPISQHDIAEASGVSASTVSRVLTNSPLISEATRQRVREVMDRLNYYPSLAARSLVTQRTYALGVVSPFIADAFAGHIFAGADSVAAENGYHILATFSHGLSEEQDLIKRFVRERRADALIVLNLNLPAEFLANLARDNMPIISVGKPAVERGIPSVSIANGPGSFELMNHMLNHGYRDIAIFTGPTGSHDGRERLAACLGVAQVAGCTLPGDRILTGDFSSGSGERLMTELLDSGKKLPEAIVALNDAMAIGAMNVMHQRGLTAPRDIAIAGFDDIEAVDLLGLTTVRVPRHMMGREAAKLALRCLNGEIPSPSLSIIPAELVIRQSCGC